MNNIKKFFICLSLCFSTASFAHEGLDKITIYGGIDAQLRHMPFKKGFGAKLFKETVPQGNAYIGIMLNNYFALEGGYEATNKKTKPAVLGAGDNGLGFVFEPGITFEEGTEEHRFTSKLQGWHVDILRFTPPLSDYALQLFAGIGVAHKRIFLLDNIFAINGSLQAPNSATFVKRKTIPRVLAGVQKMLNEQWGVRANVNWENTSRFKNLKSKENPTGITTASAKDSLTFGIGVFIKY